MTKCMQEEAFDLSATNSAVKPPGSWTRASPTPRSRHLDLYNLVVEQRDDLVHPAQHVGPGLLVRAHLRSNSAVKMGWLSGVVK